MNWDTVLRTVVIVAGCLVTAWLGFIAFVFVIRPDGTSLSDEMRLLPDTLRLVRRLAADGTIPRRTRWLVWLLVLYLASPLDLVPDFLPAIGFADDAIITAFVLRHVIRRAGPDKLQEHWPGSPDGLKTLTRLLRLPEPGAASSASAQADRAQLGTGPPRWAPGKMRRQRARRGARRSTRASPHQ